MPHPDASLTSQYFDDVYRANDDPWHFETSPYEHEKYARTLAALPRPAYANGFEIGCSLGVLTERLAARCAHLLSTDVAEAALEKARVRCRDCPTVEFRCAAVPTDFPTDRAPFDLILASEVLYYLGPDDLRAARQQITDNLMPGGHLLLVHWTPPVHDYPHTGDEVHTLFLMNTLPDGPFRHLHHERYDTYRLDLLERTR